MSNKNFASYWFNLKNEIDIDLEKLDQQGIIDKDNFYNAFQLMRKSIIQKESFKNPFIETPAEKLFEKIYEMVAAYYDQSKEEIQVVPFIPGLISLNSVCYIGLTIYLFKNIAEKMPDYNHKNFHIPSLLKYNMADSILKTKVYNYDSESSDYSTNSKQLQKLTNLINIMTKYPNCEDYEKIIQLMDYNIPILFRKLSSGGVTFDLVGTLNNKAFYQLQLNRLQEALQTINSLLSWNINYALGYYTKAEILEKMKKYNEAVEAIDKSIKLEPSSDKIKFKELISSKIK